MNFSSIAEIVAYESDLSCRDRRIIGIVGAPGAGKSTLAEALATQLDAALLAMDGFHYPQAVLVELGRRDRMGAPDTFDVDALLDTLRALRESPGSVRAPGFDRSVEEPVPGAVEITAPQRLVIVEGNYLLSDEGDWHEVAELLDVVYALELDDDRRHERLIARHEHFGKSPKQAREWALGPDEANARLIAATLDRADHRVHLD